MVMCSGVVTCVCGDAFSQEVVVVWYGVCSVGAVVCCMWLVLQRDVVLV